jgi:plastocyanin
MCDVRHFASARRAAVGSLIVLTFAGFAFAGLAFAGPALAEPTAAASSTTTVVSGFDTDCGIGEVFCYIPSSATVSVGDTVLWADQSGFRHTVTRCDPQQCEGHDGGTGSDSLLEAIVEPNLDVSRTFTGPGTYLYYCRIHTYGVMHGTITVAEQGTTTTSTTTTTTASTTTPTSAPPTTATVGATTAAATATATANSAEAVERTAPLARTGRDPRLVTVGLSIIGVGVVLVSAGHWTRRRSQ